MKARGTRGGFTLIELLAVMVLLASLSIASYISITRGSGMRSAVNNLRGTLLLARQAAMAKGRRTYVIFQSDDSYTVCQQAGIGTDRTGNPRQLTDRYADWRHVAPSNTWVYNLDRMTSSLVVAVESVSNVWTLTTQHPIWNPNGGDTYGFEIGVRTYLPRAVHFGQGSPVVPPPIVFNGDGTTSLNDQDIYLYEDMNRSYQPRVRVTRLTGFVHVTFPSG